MAQSTNDFRYVGRITGWEKQEREGAFSIRTEPTGPSSREGRQRTLSVMRSDREGNVFPWFMRLREAALEGEIVYFAGYSKPRDRGGFFWNVTKAEPYSPAEHDPKFGAQAANGSQAGSAAAVAVPAQAIAQAAGVSLEDTLRALSIVWSRMPPGIHGAESLEWLYSRGLDLVRVALKIQKAANSRPES